MKNKVRESFGKKRKNGNKKEKIKIFEQ